MASLAPVLILVFPLAGIFSLVAAHHYGRLRAFIVLAVTLISLLLSIVFAFIAPDSLSYEVGGWTAPYGIELRADALTRLMLLLTAVIFTSAAVYQSGREIAGVEPPGKLSYHLTFPLLLFSLNGLFLTGDFFNFYVFFELVAVSSYLLVAMGKHHSLEAAWKYAAISIPSSAILLSAVAFLYGLTGSLNMSDVSTRLASSAPWLAPFILTAFMIKGSLFPFHFWQPDAHAAATTAGSAILAGVLINVGIYSLLRFWPLLFGDQMRWIFLWLGMASIIFGAVAAWREADAKRLLGFSSTSQLGFVLVGMGWGTPAALTAAILFMIHHGLTKALLFLSTGVLTDSIHSTKFDDIAGAGVQAPWIRGAFLLGSLSLIGLPPAVGFLGKLSLLSAGIHINAWPWIFGIVFGTLMTLVYAARAYQALFWRVGPADGERRIGKIPGFAYLSIGILAFLILAAGMTAKPLWTMSEKAAAAVSMPAVPIREAP